MPLTDAAIRQTKPEEKPVRKTDGGGLVLIVEPDGVKKWRLRYRFQGRANMLALGKYPEVTLAEARRQRDEIKRLLSQGIDPSEQRKAVKRAPADSFEAVSREWFAKKAPTWADAHSKRVMERLENHVFPWLGRKGCAELTPAMILPVLQRIENAGKGETAHKTKQTIGQIMRYAVSTSRAETDPTAALKDALAPTKTEHFPALLDPVAIGAALRQFDAYGGYPPVSTAVRILPYVFCRPGELREMKWADVDLESRLWSYIVSKTHQPHLVPLAGRVIQMLKELQPITGRGMYVFPSQRTPNGSRPMSDAAITTAYRAMGISQDTLVAHGWRSTARTLLAEVLEYPADILEQQLGHAVKDPLGRAYNRTTFLEQRRSMMQRWADYLDELRAAA